MASILVHIESDGDRPSGVSLQALGEGRRIASTLGATLYAHAHLGRVHDENDWIQTLSAWGADRVLLTSAEADGEEPAPAFTWNHRWLVLGELSSQLGPTLLLLGATPDARQVAPRLAASLYSDLFDGPRVTVDQGQVCMSWTPPDQSAPQHVPVVDIRPRSVITLGIGPSSEAKSTPAGDPDQAGTTRMKLPDDVRARLLDPETEVKDDTSRRLGEARIVVTAGAGVASERGLELVADLARALGGELAITESVSTLGLSPEGQVIAKGVRHVTPTLYVACAASGSSRHLGAIARTATIVAINNDPDAPIFRFASYGVVGDIESVIPTLIQGLSERAAASDPERESDT